MVEKNFKLCSRLLVFVESNIHVSHRTFLAVKDSAVFAALQMKIVVKTFKAFSFRNQMLKIQMFTQF